MPENPPNAGAGNPAPLCAMLRRLLGWSLLWTLPGCLAPPVGTVGPLLSATPNPSDNGSYVVTWTPVPGASKYRLHENGLLSYQGSDHWRAYAGRAAGAYTYALTYCVSAFDIEACQVRASVPPITVVVAPP